MKQIFLFILFMTSALFVFAQEKKGAEIAMVRRGNSEYKRKKYPEAELEYRKALNVSPNMKEASFNLGVALQQQKKEDEAIKQYEKSLELLKDSVQQAHAYHNIGNAYCMKEEWEKAIDAFKKALRLKPSDMDTKYNLAFAQSKLKQQQQQQQQDQKNQDQKNKDQKDNKNDINQKGDDKKDDKKDGKDQKDNKDNKGDDKKDDKNKDGKNGDKGKQDQPKPKPGQLSREQAQRLLDAINNQEGKVQSKMQKDKGEKGVIQGLEKDW